MQQATFFTSELAASIREDVIRFKQSNSSDQHSTSISDAKAKYKELLKKEYKVLVFKHHPDQGGIDTDFKAMMQEYEALTILIDSIGASCPQRDPNNTADHTTSGYSNTYVNGTVILGVERSIRKKRAVEPQHVEIKFNVSIAELLQGFKQEIRYTRRLYYPDKILTQEVSVEVLIASQYMNRNCEIVFVGYGDQGLFDDKADLVLQLRIEDDYDIVFPSNVDELPIVVQYVPVKNWDTEYHLFDKALGIDKLLTIGNKTVSATVRGKGLRFRVADNTQPDGYRLERGNYKIVFKRYV